jgi:hypothetical protein
VIYDAADPPGRDGIARIADLGAGTMVMISPVETDSVDRTLRNGPDAERREPEARGLLSLDWRVRKPGLALQNRYPSLAAIMTGMRRVSAVLDTRGRDLELEGRIQCRDAAASGRVARFLRTIVAAGREIPRFAKLVSTLELQDSGSMVRIHWVVPPDVVIELAREPGTAASAVSVPTGTAAPSATPSAPPSRSEPLQ